MLNQFKNRGHFCNYCRKIVQNKCSSGLAYHHHTINQVIWHVWDSNDKELIKRFLSDITGLKAQKTEHLFNDQLRALKVKYIGE